MATEEQLNEALRKAHLAGDTDNAKKLAGMIQRDFRPPVATNVNDLFASPSAVLEGVDQPIKEIALDGLGDVGMMRKSNATYLANKWGLDLAQTEDNYEQVAKQIGYSGNPTEDYQFIKGWIESNKSRDLTAMEKAGVSPFLRSGGFASRLGQVKAEFIDPTFRDVVSPEDREKTSLERQAAITALSSEKKQRELHGKVEKSKTQRTFSEAIGDLKIPVFSMPDRLIEAEELLSSAVAVSKDEATDKQLEVVYSYALEAQRDSTIAANVVDIVGALPELAIGFLASGGTATATKATSKAALTKIVKKIGTEGLEKKLIARGLISTGGFLASSASRVPFVAPFITPEEYFQRATPDLGLSQDDAGNLSLLVGEEKSLTGAALKALGSTYIEIASEQLGGDVFGPLAAGAKAKLMKSSFIGAFIKANPEKSPKQIIELFKKTGLNGPVSEMLEERAGEIGRTVLLGDEYNLPSKEQLAAELIAFAIPSAGASATQKIFTQMTADGNPPSEREWKTLNKNFSDEEVRQDFEGTGLEDMVVEAKNGNLEAQQEFQDIIAPEEETGETEEPTPSLEERQTSAINKKAIAETRQQAGVDQLPENIQETHDAILERVQKDPSLIANAEVVADRVIKNREQMTEDEHAASTVRYTQLQNQYSQLIEESSVAAEQENFELNKQKNQDADSVLAKMDLLERAGDVSGTVGSARFRIRQIRLNNDDYSLATLVMQAQANKGSSLTDGERKRLEKMSKELERLQKLIQEQDKQILDLLGDTGLYGIKNAEDLTDEQREEVVDLFVKIHRQKQELKEEVDTFRTMSKMEIAAELAATPRALIATADLSATLRQGSMLSASRPRAAVKAFVKSFNAAFSQHTADEINLVLLSRPQSVEARAAGEKLTSMDRLDMASKEERFQSNFAERIKGWGAVVLGSERHMVTHLNLLRAAATDEFIADMDRRGLTDPKERLAQLRPVIAYINAASGRGNLGQFEKSAKGMAAVFFAPRFAVSRPEAIMRTAIALGGNKDVAKFIGKDFASFTGIGLTMLGLAALAGLDVGDDPDDSDFGKIIINDTRVDVWGGFLPVVRLMLNYSRTGMNLDDAPTRRDLMGQSGRFLAYKMSPSFNIPLALITGEDAVGNEVSIFNYDPFDDVNNTIFLNTVPLVIQDSIDVLKGDDPENILFTTPLVVLGVGANTYKKDRNKDSKRARFERSD